jgi:hypothetical protein
MNTYKFIKEGREWYIDLPEYLAGVFINCRSQNTN